MTQVFFDTQSAVDDLERGGFTREQAKANVRFVREALEGTVATKADVASLKPEDIAGLGARIDTLEAFDRVAVAFMIAARVPCRT